jgi:hypothetical protein
MCILVKVYGNLVIRHYNHSEEVLIYSRKNKQTNKQNKERERERERERDRDEGICPNFG